MPVIVKDGRSFVTIVVGSGASKRVKFAAEELREYLKKISGADIPIRTDKEKISGAMIHIGANSYVKSSGMSTDQLKPDGFTIKTNGEDLVLLGSDDNGTQFAVYYFLEEYCGVRWFWPGETGEYVPKKEIISLEDICVEEEPDFEWRDMGLFLFRQQRLEMSWYQAMGLTRWYQEMGEKHHRDIELWAKRNKLGGLKVFFDHSWGFIIPPEVYGETHPEYFALVNGERTCKNFDGKHGCQLCTSNPEVVRLVADYVCRYFDKNKDMDVFSISPNDGHGFCECSGCRKLDDGETVMTGTREHSLLSNRIFRFANQVAEELHRTHPEKCLIIFAYSDYRNPPHNMKIRPNVVVQYCLASYSHVNLDKKREDYLAVKKWTEACDKVAIYEYYINGSWPDLPRLIVPLIEESIRTLSGYGVRLYHTQAGDGFGVNGLNYYIASKLLWDASSKSEEILEDYCQKCFGRAKEPMRNYYDRLQKIWQEKGHLTVDGLGESDYNSLLALFSDEEMNACNDYLTRAEQLAEGKETLQRVRFVEKGFEYVKLTVDALKKTCELEDCGIPTRSLVDGTSALKKLMKDQPDCTQKAWKILKDTSKAWKLRENFIEETKTGFVISYFWIKYNQRFRQFDVSKTLERLLEIAEELNDQSKASAISDAG